MNNVKDSELQSLIDQSDEVDAQNTLNDSDLVQDAIEDGIYFHEARRWFCDICTGCYVQQFYAGILAILMVFCSVVMIQIASENYVVRKIPFVIYTENKETDHPFIEGLMEETGDAQAAMAKYLISHYVSLRESYKPNIATKRGYTNLLRLVQGMSSNQEFYQFEKYMNPYKNSKSPVLRYRNSIARYVSIKSIQFMPYNNTPDTAIVRYNVVEKKQNKIINNYDMTAKILFGMGMPRSSGDSRYDFVVLDYKNTDIQHKDKILD